MQPALGLGPVEGGAEAVVRGGRIAVLTLVVAPEAVQRLRTRRPRPPSGRGDPPRLAAGRRAERPAPRATRRRRRTGRGRLAPGPGWPRPPGRRHRDPAPARAASPRGARGRPGASWRAPVRPAAPLRHRRRARVEAAAVRLRGRVAWVARGARPRRRAELAPRRGRRDGAQREGWGDAGGDGAVRGGSRPRGLGPAAWALLVVWSVTAAGCAGRTEEAAAARAPVLYVGNGRDGTVTRLDAGGGHVLGAPLPAGEAPWQLAVGPAGELLVLPVTTRPGVRLTYVTRDPRGPGGRRARTVPLEPDARAPLLAGGGRFAVVAYQAGDAPITPEGPQPARCRVAWFDLARGRLGAARDVCGGPTRSSASRPGTARAPGPPGPTGPTGPAARSPTSPSGAAPRRRGPAGGTPAAGSSPCARPPGRPWPSRRWPACRGRWRSAPPGPPRPAPVRRRGPAGARRRPARRVAGRLPVGLLPGAVRGGAGVAGVGPGRDDPGS